MKEEERIRPPTWISPPKLPLTPLRRSAGTIAFSGIFDEIRWFASRQVNNGDGYQLTVTAVAVTSAPTPAPTLMPTAAPTIACSSSSQYSCVATTVNEVCGVEIPLTGVTPPGGVWGQDSCYEACTAKLSPPASSFIFNLYTGFDNLQHCTW